MFSRYSNVENGIIAQQLPNSGEKFIVNSASYFIEILSMNTDKPVIEGELGRIIVTDLFNYAMPLIRYDTGDIGVKRIVRTEIGEEEVFTKIEGRKMDSIFNTNGELVSSFLITNGMWNYSELIQYQFIQKNKKNYCFKLNIDKEFKREKELIEEFTEYLGKDAKIDIEYVNEIPLLSSGKRKKVLNIWHT